jgi:hypothetical protein
MSFVLYGFKFVGVDLKCNTPHVVVFEFYLLYKSMTILVKPFKTKFNVDLAWLRVHILLCL